MALEPLQKTPDVTTPAHEHRMAAPITAHAAPAVDAGRLFAGSTTPLVPVGVTVKDLDETPLSWANERVAPPTPFERFNCTAEGDAPDRISSPSQTKRKSEPTEPVHHTQHHRPEHRLLPESELPDFSNDRRSKYWNAFKSVSAQAQASHLEMGAHLEDFRHAEGDPTLRQLGYRVKSLETAESLPDLTDKQKVPLEDGMTVGSLFDSDNNVRLDKHERHAIDGAAKATSKGKGNLDKSLLHTYASDANLRGRVEEVKAKLAQVRTAASLVEAAAAAVTAHQAHQESREIDEEIRALREEATEAQEVVNVIFGLLTSVVYGATGEAGDAISQIGVVAGTLLGHVNDKRISVALKKLQTAQSKESTATRSALASQLHAAKSRLVTAHHELQGAGDDLDSSLSLRRLAYNELAASAAAEIPCPERNRHKIAGMLAAIPLVEIVIARARMLGSVSSPSYNELAARGLGMAAFYGLPVADAFRRACGELNFNRMSARLVEADWMERLQSLLDVKTRIGGLRPG